MFKTESGLYRVSGLILRIWSTNESKTPAALFSIFHMSNQVFIHPLMPLLPLHYLLFCPSTLSLLRPRLLSSHHSVFPPPCSCLFYCSHLLHLLLNHVSSSGHSSLYLFPFLSLPPPPLQHQSVLSMWTGAEISLCSPPLLSYLFHSWQAWEDAEPHWQMKGWISTCIILTLRHRRARHSPRRSWHQ